jgi:hypothetical protein
MFNEINHRSGLIFSVKTFRPLWIWPWHSSIWRQFPMRNCLVVLKWRSKTDAGVGHDAIIAHLKKLDFNEQMVAVHDALEKMASELHASGSVARYRFTETRDQAAKMRIRIEGARTS